jgi:hypothetical protein
LNKVLILHPVRNKEASLHMVITVGAECGPDTNQ